MEDEYVTPPPKVIDTLYLTGWQPIATAPKDETRILLARAGVAAMHTAFWRGGVWHCGNLSYFNNPTHWMPLPAAPV